MPRVPRALVVGVCVLLAARPAVPQATSAAPEAAAADAPAIVHDPVDCIVAGQYPQLPACLYPSTEVARGRLFFQAEGKTDWYYVELKPEAPCWNGVLPKPSKALVDRHIHYYFEGTWRSMATARTAEYSALVVRSKGECRNPIVAALAASGPAAVLPAIPAGFTAAGFPTALAVAGAGAIAGGAAAVVVAAPADPTPTPSPGPTSPPTPAPTPNPTPAPTPGPTPTPSPSPSPSPTPGPTPTP